MTRFLLVGGISLLMLACEPDTKLFPEYIEKFENTEVKKNFLERYLKTYESSLHMGSWECDPAKGKVLIAKTGENIYRMAFYLAEVDRYRILSDPVEVKGSGEPHSSEYLAKNVPAIVVKQADGSSRYVYVHQGRVHETTL